MLETQINRFISYCKVSNFTEKSIESLSVRLGEFNTFIKSRRIRKIASITYSHLLIFVADYREPSVHIRKARVWSLRQFFHFMKLNGWVSENIALGLDYPKIEKKVPVFLTENELNRILACCAVKARSLIGLRDLIIVMMLGLLGLRTGALTKLNIQDIDLTAGLARVNEKGTVKRLIVLPEILCAALKGYLDKRKEIRGPLLVSVRGKRISPRTLQDVFRNVADIVGIDKRLHAHLFRHTAATHLNRVGGTDITQGQLGHRRRTNTQQYAHLNPDNYASYMRQHPFMKS